MRILEKIQELKGYVAELSTIMPHDFNEYENDIKTKAACERYFERIIGTVIDVSFLVIKEKGYKIPEEDKEAFDILANERIIEQALAERLKDAKGMRNIIAHEYGDLDDLIVFNSITKELIKDTKEFVTSVKKHSNLPKPI